MRSIPGLRKVRDFHAPPSEDITSMVREMGRSGGFMAKNLFDVADTLASMCDREGCTKFLSFPAAIMATGTRGVIIDMVRAGWWT